jgi:hypothetical protein
LRCRAPSPASFRHATGDGSRNDSLNSFDYTLGNAAWTLAETMNDGLSIIGSKVPSGLTPRLSSSGCIAQA